jgi:hypothetical protein
MDLIVRDYFVPIPKHERECFPLQDVETFYSQSKGKKEGPV